VQLQLHSNPGLLDYEAGTLTSSPVAFVISLLQTIFFFPYDFHWFFLKRKSKNLDPPFGHVRRSFRGIKSSITAIAVMEFFIPEKRPKPKSGPA
jgi:hypothetical protein